jgi:hypothetical protein
VTINYIISVRPSVRPLRTTRIRIDGFLLNIVFDLFLKICRESSCSISLKINDHKFCNTIIADLAQYTCSRMFDLQRTASYCIVPLQRQLCNGACQPHCTLPKICAITDNLSVSSCLSTQCFLFTFNAKSAYCEVRHNYKTLSVSFTSCDRFFACQNQNVSCQSSSAHRFYRKDIWTKPGNLPKDNSALKIWESLDRKTLSLSLRMVQRPKQCKLHPDHEFISQGGRFLILGNPLAFKPKSVSKKISWTTKKFALPKFINT